MVKKNKGKHFIIDLTFGLKKCVDRIQNILVRNDPYLFFCFCVLMFLCSCVLCKSRAMFLFVQIVIIIKYNKKTIVFTYR